MRHILFSEKFGTTITSSFSARNSTSMGSIVTQFSGCFFKFDLGGGGGEGGVGGEGRWWGGNLVG